MNRDSGKASKKLAYVLALTMLLAVSLRLVGANSKSLWMDEIVTVLDARLNWTVFVQQRGSWDYPCLFFLLVKLSTILSESPFRVQGSGSIRWLKIWIGQLDSCRCSGVWGPIHGIVRHGQRSA